MEKHDNEYQQKMMELVRDTFQLNAFLDNCAYHLDFYNLPVTQDIVHHKFAHLAPGWADEITEFLSTQGVRSVRLGLSDEITDYFITSSSMVKNKYVTEQYLENNNYITTSYVDTKIEALELSIKNEVQNYVKQTVNDMFNDKLDEKIDEKIKENIESIEDNQIVTLF